MNKKEELIRWLQEKADQASSKLKESAERQSELKNGIATDTLKIAYDFKNWLTTNNKKCSMLVFEEEFGFGGSYGRIIFPVIEKIIKIADESVEETIEDVTIQEHIHAYI